MRFRSPTQLACVGLLTLAAACGGEPTPPPAPPTPPPPTVAAAPPPSVEAPAPSAAASAEPSKPVSSGRPPVIFSNETGLTETFGSSPGAKVEIGTDKDHLVVRIQENTLHVGHNIGFKVDPRGKSAGGQVGKIYHVIPNIPPDPKPVVIEASDPPFLIGLSNGGKKSGVNLAVGRTTQDDKGKEKVVWTIYAPKVADDGAGLTIFEVPSLGDDYLHLTSKPADAKK